MMCLPIAPVFMPCNLSTPSSLFNSDVFLGDPLSSATLYVPIGSVSTYTATGGVWGNFGTFAEFYNLKINKLSTDGEGNYYATLYQTVPLNIPSGVTAKYPTSAVSGALSYSNYTGIIPASAAALVTATSPGRYFFVKNSNNTAAAPDDNLLVGVVANTTVSSLSDYYYTLSRDVDSYGNPVAGSVSFYWYASDGHSVTCPAGRAYLMLSASGGEAIRTFRLGDSGVTSVSLAQVEEAKEHSLYTLDGRVAREPLREGIYIKDGKKIWIRK